MAGERDDDDREEIQVVIPTEGEEPIRARVVDESSASDRIRSDEGGEDENGHDDGGVEGDAAASRTRRRRQRQREAAASKDRTIAELQGRLEQLSATVSALSNNQVGLAGGSLDARAREVSAQYADTEAQLAAAVEQGNGALVTRLMARRDALRDEANRVVAAHARLTSAVQNEQTQRHVPQAAPPPVNRMADAHMSRFMDSVPFFDPASVDPDSMVVKALDDSVAAEGFDPGTKEYWSELERRVRERLPEKFGDRRVKPSGTRFPPIGGSRTASGGARVVELTPEMKDALEQSSLLHLDPNDKSPSNARALERRERILAQWFKKTG